ncbi:MAG: J domain-containing protein [Synechococcales cyanobacterium T60_A2020_003]|nr:J domain-containing protein [Synechococcales cyanobacterium T60_A2020_003]
MNVSDCYRILGLRTGASAEDVKASYRRLVRRYHPDVNPHNQEQAKDRFIQLTEAYRVLRQSVLATPPVREPNFAEVRQRSHPVSPEPPTVSKPASRQSSPQAPPPSGSSPSSASSSSPAAQPQARSHPSFETDLSEADQELKQNAYYQLQTLLKTQRFPRAIALVEGLAQRLPQDLEVRQWQAITYQRWGRQLVSDRQFDKARIYLQKALKTDARNRSLWTEVQRDLRCIDEYQQTPQATQLER